MGGRPKNFGICGPKLSSSSWLPYHPRLLEMDELPVVGALRALSIFSADQEAAYREHFGATAAVLGQGVTTRIGARVAEWVASSESALWILTGNAGTGKTAVAELFSLECQGELPKDDALTEVAAGRWVAKDLSGLATESERAETLERAIELASSGSQVLICANEGVLRDAVRVLAHAYPWLPDLLDSSLRGGAAESEGSLIVNLNRQRPTAANLWNELLDYITAEDLWAGGCDACPLEDAGCPMRENARALRDADTREGIRFLVRLASGEAVPTLREVLAILSWAIVSDWTCDRVRKKARDQALSAFTAADAYFPRALGYGLSPETVERSPLLAGMRYARLGEISDLQVDEWLRDTTSAPAEIRRLAGAPELPVDPSQAENPLAGTRGSHDRVTTAEGTMTFHALGETVATSEDLARVDAGLRALVQGEGMPRQALWRQRVFFEQPGTLGGLGAAGERLLETRYLHDLLELAQKVAEGRDATLELAQIIQGLNFLVCGFASSNEGLVVPDPSCLFARDPGSFRPAKPSFVHTQVPWERLELRAPDNGLVREYVDVDHTEVDLVVWDRIDSPLRLRPRLYEAVREAAAFRGPVGQGIAEMADVRSFFGSLASSPGGDVLRVADPNAERPAFITVRTPHFQESA
jgi:hypothetical protein